ncbi:transposase [Streptomyces hirsutus]
MQVRAIEEAVLARWQPRVRARRRAQAEAEGFVFHTQARFGFAAPAGSSDDPRVRWITQYLPGEVARELFAEFADAWGRKYPAIVRLWENAWEEFTPFLRFDTEIRRVVCTTNAIESVNARIRRAVKARGHFPNETAALKCVYMAIMSLDPTGKGQARWTMRWKTALNAFDITFDGRLSAARQ